MAKANQTPILQHAWPAGEVGRHSVSPRLTPTTRTTGILQADLDSVLFSAGAGGLSGVTARLQLSPHHSTIPSPPPVTQPLPINHAPGRVVELSLCAASAGTPLPHQNTNLSKTVVLPACHVAPPLRWSLQDLNCWQPSCGTDARSTGEGRDNGTCTEKVDECRFKVQSRRSAALSIQKMRTVWLDPPLCHVYMTLPRVTSPAHISP